MKRFFVPFLAALLLGFPPQWRDEGNLGRLGAADVGHPILETIQPNAWWSGTDLTKMLQPSTANVSASGQEVDSWEDSIGGVVVTHTNDEPIYHTSGLGVEFDQAATTGGLRDDATGNLSRFNYMHNGTGASVFLRIQILNFTSAPTTIVDLLGTRRNAGGQTGFAIRYWSNAGGGLWASVANGSTTFQSLVLASVGGSGTTFDAVVNFSSTGVSASLNGGAFGAEAAYGAFVPSANDASYGLCLGADPVGVLAPGDIVLKEVAFRDSLATDADVAAWVSYDPDSAL